MKISLILFMSLFLFALEASANWKKKCKKYEYESSGNDVYVGNPGKSYPHIHCQKGFIVFSHAKKKHTDLAQGDKVMCAKINEATKEWYQYMKEADKAKGLIDKLKADYCKRMSMMKRLLMRLLLEN